MPQQDLRKSSAQCEVIMQHPYEYLTVNVNQECCYVQSSSGYMKAQTYSAKGNRKFRVRIEIESIPDDETSNAYESIHIPQRKSQTESSDNESDAQNVSKMPYSIEEIYKAAKA